MRDENPGRRDSEAKWTVLAVSSSEERNRYRGLLSSADFRIREAASHEEAVNLLERMDVSALVCEVHGRGVDGMKPRTTSPRDLIDLCFGRKTLYLYEGGSASPH